MVLGIILEERSSPTLSMNHILSPTVLDYKPALFHSFDGSRKEEEDPFINNEEIEEEEEDVLNKNSVTEEYDDEDELIINKI